MDNCAPFIPLPRALEIVAARLPPAHYETQALACTMSALVTLYALDGAGARPLEERELSGALFAPGADCVTFANGRPPITGLAVAGDAVERVVRVLQGATLQVEG